jgi:dTDP-4-dehydrorhamnose 3,5-epimerase
MNFTPLALDGVVLITPDVFEDQRGFFMESWNQRKFAAAGIDAPFVQDNHSRSVRGTLRGLHYQLRRPQGKLVRVTAGEVFDVVVDIRRSSPTFGRWLGTTLSAERRQMLWVPPGFAHGFYVLSDCADFLYKCTEFYAPEDERSIRWDDPDIGVEWPLVGGSTPFLSRRDASAGLLREAEVYP